MLQSACTSFAFLGELEVFTAFGLRAGLDGQ